MRLFLTLSVPVFPSRFFSRKISPIPAILYTTNRLEIIFGFATVTRKFPQLGAFISGRLISSAIKLPTGVHRACSAPLQSRNRNIALKDTATHSRAYAYSSGAPTLPGKRHSFPLAARNRHKDGFPGVAAPPRWQTRAPILRKLRQSTLTQIFRNGTPSLFYRQRQSEMERAVGNVSTHCAIRSAVMPHCYAIRRKRRKSQR